MSLAVPDVPIDDRPSAVARSRPDTLPVQPLIEAKGLERRFGSFVAVQGVSFSVAPGEVLALLGPNGAGKTTTLQMLAGLLPPSAGRATVAGFDVVRQSDEVRARVGLMVDEPGFYPEMTVSQYLPFVGRLYGLNKPAARAAMDELLARFGLESKRHARLSSLSKGMRQKVALIRAVIHRPPVLLLDEPTSALDPLSARAVHDFIRERRAMGDAIIICTHNLPEAEDLADRVAIVAASRLRRLGTRAALCRAPDGLESYALTLASASSPAILDVLAETPGLTDLTLASPADRRGDAGDASRHHLTYRTRTPDATNAAVTMGLAAHGVAVLELTPRPYSLSQVYLRTIEEAAT